MGEREREKEVLEPLSESTKAERESVVVAVVIVVVVVAAGEGGGASLYKTD